MKITTVFLCMLLISITVTAQINVPADYPTIQQAIDNANVNDVIILANGTYTENLIIDKPLTIQSVNPNVPSNVFNTILDGSLSGSVIKAQNINGTVAIKGLTIQNGSGSDFEISPSLILKTGGGIFAENITNLIVERVNISDNSITTTNNFGAGLFSYNTNLTVNFATFERNYNQSVSFFGNGAAMYLLNSNVMVDGSMFRFNYPDGYDDDAVIYASESNLSVTNSTISDNANGVIVKATDLNIDNVTFTNMSRPLQATGNTAANSIDDIDNVTTISNTIFNSNLKGYFGTLRFKGTEVHITDTQINDNENGDTTKSGAINALYSNIAMDNCEVKNNTASYLTTTGFWYAGNGAGFKLYECIANISNTNISNNLCNSETPFDAGGAMYFTNSEVTLNNCTVMNNSANNGGAFYTFNSILKLNKTVVANNTAENGGFLYSGSNTVQLVSSTITKNTSLGSSIYTHNNDDFVVVNSILWNEGNFEFSKNMDGQTSNLNFSNSNIRGMDANFENNNLLNKTWLAGNLDTNPLFVDEVNNDFNLANNSPLINTGTAFFTYNNEILLDLNSSDYVGNAPDIGAFENQNALSATNEVTTTNMRIYSINKQQVRVNSTNFSKITSIKVYDIVGRLLSSLKPTTSQYQIDVTIANKGVLLFIVAVENGKTIKQKFIAMK